MKKSVSLRTRVMAVLVLAAVGAVAVWKGNLLSWAFWDESTAMHINPRTIESSTLAIGTHLIHLSALTDSIYEIAEQSAEESGQFQIYYKSELGGDAWFDITSASTLEEITTGGSPVQDEVIEALFFTHHTKSDKVTYDLRTGQAVNIFDIRDPYDLENLDELSPLKMKYDQVYELQGEDEITQRIDQIWQIDVSSPPSDVDVEDLKTRNEYDQILTALQNYLSVLSDNDGGETEMGKVNEVMEAVDACRRYLVYANAEIALEEYLDELGEGAKEEAAAAAEGEEEEPAAAETPSVSTQELMSAVSESLGNVQNAMITYSGKMLSEGVTVMSSAEYTFSNDLIDHAKNNNHAACDQDVAKLVALDNILNDVISQRSLELELLNGTLLPQATSEYTTSLWSGENGEYLAEVAKQSSQALLNRLISENESEVNTRRGELEFLIQAWCNRMDPQSSLDFMDERLTLTTGSFLSGVPQDDFAQGAQDSVQAHIDFLTQLRREFELALGGNEMDQLLADKDDLQTQRLAALDRNDLAGAKELENQLEALEEEIRAKEEESANQIAGLQDQISSLEDQLAQNPDDQDLKNQLSDAQAQLATAQAGLSDGTLGAMVENLKNNALDGIDNGDTAATGDAVDGLAGLMSTAPSLVLPALQEVHDALVLGGGDQDLVDTIEQAILDNPGAMWGDLTADELKSRIEDYMEDNGVEDASFFNLTGDDALTALLAMQLYYDDTASRAALSLIGSLSQRQLALGNSGVFYRINDSTGEYLPLTAIQYMTGRRYVWEKNNSLGILAQGADYYGFTMYSNAVLRDRDGEKTETMARIAKYLNVIHIPEEYSYDSFGVQAVYLSGTELGCAYDDAIMTQAQELLARLLTV